jgi:2-polyprenyl-6-methoxyphenol hydroxylase-like FAD-dependent oxidoreductase
VHPRFLCRALPQGDRINGLVDGVTGDWYCKFDTFHPAVDNGLPVTRVISRVTLQSILAGGLPESAVMNNCKVSAFEDSEDCVTAVLEDGRRISGDVLIGADGAQRARHRKTSAATRVSGADACLCPARQASGPRCARSCWASPSRRTPTTRCARCCAALPRALLRARLRRHVRNDGHRKPSLEEAASLL